MKKTSFFVSIVVLLLSIGCKKSNSSPSLTATTTINSVGNSFGGDVTGNGGTTTQNFTWNNPQPSAGYSMDIKVPNSVANSSFQLIIKDANGTIVLNQTLVRGQTVDSYSGSTNSGVPGNWSISVILKYFNASGSFSMSPQ